LRAWWWWWDLRAEAWWCIFELFLSGGLHLKETLFRCTRS